MSADRIGFDDFERIPDDVYRDWEVSNGQTRKSEEKSSPQPFAVTALDAIEAPDTPETVQGLYGPGQVIAKVGAPNAGKTALGVDHGLAIAANETWFGRKVSGGPVVYFAPEAPGSVIMRARAAAAHKYPNRRLPFYISIGTPALGGDVTHLTDAERMIATIQQVQSHEGLAVKLAVVDTLASCLGNGDENGEGMIRLVSAAKFVAAEAGVAVMLIHHPSKGDANGLRGHGSLAAACDTILTISVDEVSKVRTATLIKSRDSATGLQFCYTLEAVTLPEPDSFGDPRTTIIVKPVTVQKARVLPKGKQQQALLLELERRYRTGETGWSEAVIGEAGRTLGMHRNTVRDAIKGLVNAGHIWGQPANLTLKYAPDDERTKCTK